MLTPPIDDVEYEDSAERVRVVMPVERHHAFLAMYTVLLLVWLGVTFWMLLQLIDTPLRTLPLGFAVAWVVILLIWGYVWYRLGRHVWRWWQYYAASREILYVYDDLLVVRRPLSIFGVTDGYDMEHVSPFYYSDKQEAVAFSYGSRGGYFGHALPETDARRLIGLLNRRFFGGASPPAGER
ncbi:MAG: hypothetical protein R3272_08250 [Candidatus Promineifilaceae bacterium]|nr:hypothetical protein [Candidatus Promineifilaceae bacterium]